MKKIALGGKNGVGKFALVDDGDYDYLNQWKWRIDPKGYALRTKKINGKQKILFIHRVIMNLPSGIRVDHKDGNALNNQRSNLRECTAEQNQRNRGKQRNNKSGYKGVFFDKARRKWRAMIGMNGRLIHLGFFIDKVDAAKAYDRAALKYFGEFAWLNFHLSAVS